MKKHNLKLLTLAVVLCVSLALSGCASNALTTQTLGKSTANSASPVEQANHSADIPALHSTSAAEACESDEGSSPAEQTKAEEIRRAEIAEQYSVYEPYGMRYDQEKDRFFYNDQMVRSFNDPISAESTNAFFFEDGIIDVEPIRTEKGVLTRLKQSTDAEFKSRTETQEAIKAELEAAGMTGDSGSFELGDPNDRDDSLEAYCTFGVSYDKASAHWLYAGKAIHILYDADHHTYCDNGVSKGINLKVVRDQNGKIEKLVEAEIQEVEQYVSEAAKLMDGSRKKAVAQQRA